MSSVNHVGSSGVQPYTAVADFTTTLRTVESGADAAANRFIVPITLVSCMARCDICVGSTIRKVCTIVSTRVARTILARIE